MIKQDELMRIFSMKLRAVFGKLNVDYDKVQEIRLRAQAPLLMIYDNQEYFVSESTGLTKVRGDALVIHKNEIKETMEYISNYSLYAFEEEMRQGFITIQGGHRIGITGKVVMEDNHIKAMKHISYLNVRLAHQVKGCADHVLPYIYSSSRFMIYHTLIVSPPRCGKTTLLRDLIRQISDGENGMRGFFVGVVDERSEIGACYMGVPQNDLGIRTDILDCCPKARGMMMLIRSMSPDVIAVDEVGSREDMEAIEYAMNCGSRIIATVHGNDMEELRHKPILCDLIQNHVFERFLILSNRHGIGTLEGVFDHNGKNLLTEKDGGSYDN